MEWIWFREKWEKEKIPNYPEWGDFLFSSQ